MIDLLSSSHTEEDDIYQIFNLSRGSSLYAAWLWDGILLWGNEIRLDKLSYPMTLFNENDYLLLNICHAGRCEVELSPGTYVYMSPGTLNVSASPPKSSYCYPGGYYEGIEVCLDLRRLKGNMPEALADYGLKFDVLRRYTEEGNVMASLTNAGIQEEEKLFRMLREGHSSVYELRFAALSLICHLIGGDAQRIDCGISITKGQRRIVTEAEQMMTNDLRERYTVEELSSRFGIRLFSGIWQTCISIHARKTDGEGEGAARNHKRKHRRDRTGKRIRTSREIRKRLQGLLRGVAAGIPAPQQKDIGGTVRMNMLALNRR